MPISPNQGSTGGGTVVTITGTNLSGATAVKFGTKPGTITANTPTSITVTSPSGSGTVGVTVTTPGGTSNPLAFYYIGAPFKAALSSDSGPVAGGNTITITGTGLSTANNVAFGANSATPTVVSDNTINVVVPAGAAGAVGVTITTAGGSNNGLTYTYVTTPTVTSIAPSAGPTSGGTAATVTGTGLTSTQSVTVGGAIAPFTVINDTELSIVTPPGAAGSADVDVTTTGGTASIASGFTYTAGPGI